MKRLFYVFVLILGVGLNCVAQDCVINVKAKGLPDRLVVNLFKLTGKVGTLVASDSVKDESFRFVVPLDSGLNRAEFTIDAPGFSKSYRYLLLRPGAKVEITGNDPYVSAWEVRSDVPEQAEYDLFINNEKDLIIERDNFEIEKDSALAAAPDKESRTAVIRLFDERRLLQDSIEYAIFERDVDLLEKLPVTPIWFSKFEDVCRFREYYDKEGALIPRLEALYNGLEGNVKESKSGERINMLLNPPDIVGEGDILPDSEFFDIEGKMHTLEEFEGKWILLDFWSSGCYPCIMAIPELKGLKDKYASDLAVVSLSTDVESVWKDASERHKLTGNNWNEMKEDLGLYRVFNKGAIPLFVLVSPEGVVKWIDAGFSKGSLERTYKFFSKERGKSEIVRKDGYVEVENPSFLKSNAFGVIEIERIVMTPEGVTINFIADYVPKNWIKVASGSKLITTDGKGYAIIGSEGITPGKELYVDDNGKAAFNITFEPIPLDSESIDFRESDNDDSWYFTGIKLK
jgi:hypothetical protein